MPSSNRLSCSAAAVLAMLFGASPARQLIAPGSISVRFHRVLRATIDARVGGVHKTSFTNFTTGKSHSFGGTYLELVPGERIRYTDRFDSPNMPGEMQTTIAVKKVSCGTELHIVQEGLPEAIPPEACCLGWQESLALLASLVEAKLPD